MLDNAAGILFLSFAANINLIDTFVCGSSECESVTKTQNDLFYILVCTRIFLHEVLSPICCTLERYA